MKVSLRYPSSLQHFGASQALVDEEWRLLVAVGQNLHLGVDRVQVPAKGVTLQAFPQCHALTNVSVGAFV